MPRRAFSRLAVATVASDGEERAGRTLPPPQPRGRSGLRGWRPGHQAPYLQPPSPELRAAGRRARGCGRGDTRQQGPWRGAPWTRRDGARKPRGARCSRRRRARSRLGTLGHCAPPPPLTARRATPARCRLPAYVPSPAHAPPSCPLPSPPPQSRPRALTQRPQGTVPSAGWWLLERPLCVPGTGCQALGIGPDVCWGHFIVTEGPCHHR